MKKAAASADAGREVLSVRIPHALKERLVTASSAPPYRVPIVAIVERGLEMALRELEETRKRKYVATLNYRSGSR